MSRLTTIEVDKETARIEFLRGIPEEASYSERYVLLTARTRATSKWQLSVEGGEDTAIEPSEVVIASRDYSVSVLAEGVESISEYALSLYPTHHA